jgi:UDP-N-acetylmuramoyl-tripeptide--D-alanyl-D-alanine ligase
MKTEELYHLFKECNYQVSTDTRKPVPGSLFICLKGASFDANTFAKTAIEGGCAFALASDLGVCDGQRIHYVPDTLLALQELAVYHRQQMGAVVIGIAGSNGKTTTKELTAAVLARKFNTIATQGNLNNHIGVPLTLLKIRPETEMAVVELGTNHPGEIEALCRIALPDSGIITNIGKEHLEGFGSLEGVAKEESELYRFLQLNNGTAFVNADDEWLMRMASRLKKVVKYGMTQPGGHPKLSLSQSFPTLEWSIQEELSKKSFHSALAGVHNLSNILAACTIGIHYGVEAEEAFEAVQLYIPANNRSQWVRSERNLIWLDAYNANPSSMEAAMRSFALWNHPHKVLMLGDMFELGDAADSEHKAIAELADKLGFHEVYLVGEHFHRVVQNTVKRKVFLNIAQLKNHLQQFELLDAAVLVKGSRGVAMESLADIL